MDIKTPLGRLSLAREQSIIRKLCEKMSWFNVPTPRDMPAPLDGVMSDNTGMIFVYEVKCRNTTVGQLYRWGTYLISHSKIVAGMKASELFNVPFVILVHTTKDGGLVSIRVTNEYGEAIAPMDVKETDTQATVNGGSARRKNAYVCMSAAKIINI